MTRIFKKHLYSGLAGLCLCLLLAACQSNDSKEPFTVITSENAFSGFPAVRPYLLDAVDSVRGVFRQDFILDGYVSSKSIKLVLDRYENGQLKQTHDISDAIQIAQAGPYQFHTKISAYAIPESPIEFNLQRFVIQSVIGLQQNGQPSLIQKSVSIPLGLMGNYKFDSSAYKTDDQGNITLMAYQEIVSEETKPHLFFTVTKDVNSTVQNFVDQKVKTGTGFVIRYVTN